MLNRCGSNHEIVGSSIRANAPATDRLADHRAPFRNCHVEIQNRFSKQELSQTNLSLLEIRVAESSLKDLHIRDHAYVDRFPCKLVHEFYC